MPQDVLLLSHYSSSIAIWTLHLHKCALCCSPSVGFLSYNLITTYAIRGGDDLRQCLTRPQSVLLFSFLAWNLHDSAVSPATIQDCRDIVLDNARWGI